ncbi:MAG: nickel pincer cofactor biosynthesis protein LarB [Alphaproteobacteria bacterium]|nr:nickel pincer cofactor biosynthesis protein LarB [Alphaproteobacteria bacterium]MDP6515900.1 nickel pincer cofactor biosynthesis protein LarB [Alphaproteobacteria bacterium]
MNDLVTPDLDRARRIGIEEAVLCAGKSVAQLAGILDLAATADHTLLLTRLEAKALDALPAAHREAIDYDPLSRTAFFGTVAAPDRVGEVAIVTAGTSDVAVATEAARTLAYAGRAAAGFDDLGVAGLWRLLDQVDALKAFPVVIAVAGMDGAMVSVIGGLVPGAVIAVPTSTGYGAARGGETALAAALASCAPGIVVVNIDNGYGAACAALRVLHQVRPRR